MTATIETARDEIHTLFKDAWDANSDSQDISVYYWDTPQNIPDGNSSDGNPLSWARITVQHTDAQQGLTGGNGKKRYTRSGIVTVQIFTPFGTGLSLADNLAMITLQAFEGKSTPSHVWFRNVRSTEIGQDGVWFQTNVIAEFIYDEVR